MNDAKQVLSGRSITVGVVIAVVLALIIIPLVVDLSNYILTLMVSLLIYITLSESWNLMGGYAGQINLGLAAYFGIGSLFFMLVYIAGAPWYVALLVGGLAGTVLSCIIGPPTLRLRGAYFGIGTMALAEVARLVSTTLYALPFYSPPSYWLTFTPLKSYYIALAVAAGTLAVAYWVTHSRLGMVLQAIRECVGDNIPVLIKMNSKEFVDGGLQTEEFVQAGKMLADAGIDAIEISGGLPVSASTRSSQLGINKEEKEAYFQEQARALRRQTDVPIILVGGNRSFHVAERLVGEGVADYISMSRPLIREPDLINRWKTGDFVKSACVSDNMCFQAAMEGKGIYCVTEERERAKKNRTA